MDLEAKAKPFEGSDSAAKPRTDATTADAAAAAAAAAVAAAAAADEITMLKDLLAKAEAAAAVGDGDRSAQVEELRVQLHASETALRECREQHAASESRIHALADEVGRLLCFFMYWMEATVLPLLIVSRILCEIEPCLIEACGLAPVCVARRWLRGHNSHVMRWNCREIT